MKKRRQNHAEIIAFGYSHDAGHADKPVISPVWCDSMNDGTSKVTEKVLGVLLAAASVVLCAAIDYLLKKEG